MPTINPPLQTVCANCEHLIECNFETDAGEKVWCHPLEGRHTVCEWTEGTASTHRVATLKSGEDFIDLTGIPHVEGDAVTAARQVLATGYALVGGVLLDAFTASAIVQVYEALNPANQVKFAAMPLPQAASVTWKLIERSKA